MEISFLENRTGQEVTFRRYVLGGWRGTQTDQTHKLTLCPGYNVLPEDARVVPTYFGQRRPIGTPSVDQLNTDQYFEMSHISLQVGSGLLWAYADYDDNDQLIRSPGADIAKRGDLTSREELEMVGGHGTAWPLRKITFDNDSITHALVTKEEMQRISIELAARQT